VGATKSPKKNKNDDNNTKDMEEKQKDLSSPELHCRKLHKKKSILCILEEETGDEDNQNGQKLKPNKKGKEKAHATVSSDRKKVTKFTRNSTKLQDDLTLPLLEHPR
jgi:hypothetical protein